MTAVAEPKQFERKVAKRKNLRDYRWTRHEVYALCDSGWFSDKRVNLINGRIIVTPLSSSEHNYTVDTLVEYLRTIVPAAYYVRSEKALGVSLHNDPGPDAAIVKGTRHDYLKDHPTTAIFVSEVSKTTLHADLNVKPFLYALAGVPEYWVIDLVHRRLIVHRDPILDEESPMKHRYALVRTLEAADSLAPHFAPNSVIEVAVLLPPNA